MSTTSARFIIDREVSKEIFERYDIKDLENKRRYYLANIVNPEDHVVEKVLIDKLRTIHFQKDKHK